MAYDENRVCQPVADVELLFALVDATQRSQTLLPERQPKQTRRLHIVPGKNPVVDIKREVECEYGRPVLQVSVRVFGVFDDLDDHLEEV